MSRHKLDLGELGLGQKDGPLLWTSLLILPWCRAGRSYPPTWVEVSDCEAERKNHPLLNLKACNELWGRTSRICFRGWAGHTPILKRGFCCTLRYSSAYLKGLQKLQHFVVVFEYVRVFSSLDHFFLKDVGFWCESFKFSHQSHRF